MDTVLIFFLVVPLPIPTRVSCGGFRREEVVDLLLNYGADVNCKKLDGASPLHIAAEKGHEKVFIRGQV